MDLFTNLGREPLAARMRPQNLSEYIGQSAILGEGRLLRRMIQADRLSSLIFYGPPGTGKTTLAQVIANTTKSSFASLNAVLSGIKELREEIEKARERKSLYDKKTILFVDEVHRWNKAQQDALLPWVENGTVILIGATTENPYFEVNKALVSRSRIFQLQPLTNDELAATAWRAINQCGRGYGDFQVTFEAGALEHLIKTAEGDARNLLNALELAVETTPDSFPPPLGSTIHITLATAEESIQQKAVLYDKEGDYHYDTISAFIKSLRGSDPDAALYWMARMVSAGESPHFIFRRMLIAACEDVGLADPNAIRTVEACAAAFDRIGMPEGHYMLSLAALYLATCPKSNSTMAFFDAMEAVKKEKNGDVPNALKDPNRDSQDFGHGKGYLYPHAYREHWVAQQYLPTALQGRLFYEPTQQGYESQIAERVRQRRELQLAQFSEEEESELLTFSYSDKDHKWLMRLNSNLKDEENLRNRSLDLIKWKRYYNVLDLNAGGGFLTWEALRRTPEGSLYGCCTSDEQKQLLDYQAKELSPEHRPVILTGNDFKEQAALIPSTLRFEVLLLREFFLLENRTQEVINQLTSLAAPGAQILLLQTLPQNSTRLSQLLSPSLTPTDLLTQMQRAEDFLYSDPNHPLLNLNLSQLCQFFEIAGWKKNQHHEWDSSGFRYLPKERIESWLGDKGVYAPHIPKENIENLRQICLNQLGGKNHPWKKKMLAMTFKLL